MTSKTKKLRAGAFVIGALGLFAFVLMIFGGLKFWEDKATYRIEFAESVRGLEKGAYVYLEGIRVGSVTEIGFGTTPTAKVVVTVEVKEDTPIYTDTRALLQYAGITGLKVIDLESGTPTNPRIASGGTIPQGESTLDKFEQQAKEIAEQSTELMKKANQIVDNVAKITEPSQFASLQEIMANTKQLTANLAKATGSLDAMVAENRVAVKSSLASVREAATRATEMLDGHVGSLVSNADTFLSRLDDMVRANEGPLRSAVFDLRQASRNFKELSREVRQRPSRLLFSDSPSERKLP
jgi:phospholipid/cholesterol/gamma-HCH transport system substrate-binding protein